MIEVKGTESFNRPQVIVHDTEMLYQEARIAIALIERWGCVAAKPDGEDSAGRSKLALQTPEELVLRAFEVAALAMIEARKRGLIYDAPTLTQVEQQIQEERDKERERLEKSRK